LPINVIAGTQAKNVRSSQAKRALQNAASMSRPGDLPIVARPELQLQFRRASWA
jgi:hypothetical protein